jgi:hypothetical protein
MSDARRGGPITIKVVGPCKSGKSTLAAGLSEHGYQTRVCGQEHSEVPDMWQRIAPPTILVYLDVSLASIQRRSDRSDWTQAILDRQDRRLVHARQHSDLLVFTDDLSPDQVLRQVLDSLENLTDEARSCNESVQ